MTSTEWFDIDHVLADRQARSWGAHRECIWELRLALAEYYHDCAAARRAAAR